MGHERAGNFTLKLDAHTLRTIRGLCSHSPRDRETIAALAELAELSWSTVWWITRGYDRVAEAMKED